MVGQWVKMASKIEVRWYQYLCFMERAGHMRDIQYQPGSEIGSGRPTFTFTGETSKPMQYTLDFRVTIPAEPAKNLSQKKKDTYMYYECKGIISSDLVSKCKRLAKHYINVRLSIVTMSLPKRGGIQWRRLQRISDISVVDRVIVARPIFKQLGIK